MTRELAYSEALREALDLCLENDRATYLFGLGVPDPKGIFGSTSGLAEKHGAHRVFDMPVSENGMTGVAIGSALVGMKPIMTHQRLDFALLAVEQIVNQAAKWSYMFGGARGVPLVIRMVIGRGWGQGPQHSQSLQAWFAHVPGLKVVMPATPHDAKGLLIASVEDGNPVIFLEHRWLYGVRGPVPEGLYRVPLGTCRVLREGKDVTIVGVSYMALEALQAAQALREEGIEAEVIDVRTLRPLGASAILESVNKTGRLIVADTGWVTGGFGGEIVALAAEQCFDSLVAPPRRVGLPDSPTPTSPALSDRYYPRALDLVAAARELLGSEERSLPACLAAAGRLDVPHSSFQGPF